MGRAVKITDGAYQALSYRAENLGMSRAEYLSKLIIAQPLEEPKGIITTELPKNIETTPKLPLSPSAMQISAEKAFDSPTNAKLPGDQEIEPKTLEERYPDLIGMFGRERNRYLYNLVLEGKISKEEYARGKG